MISRTLQNLDINITSKQFTKTSTWCLISQNQLQLGNFKNNLLPFETVQVSPFFLLSRMHFCLLYDVFLTSLPKLHCKQLESNYSIFYAWLSCITRPELWPWFVDDHLSNLVSFLINVTFNLMVWRHSSLLLPGYVTRFHDCAIVWMKKSSSNLIYSPSWTRRFYRKLWEGPRFLGKGFHIKHSFHLK